jgi:hypothetical protein
LLRPCLAYKTTSDTLYWKFLSPGEKLNYCGSQNLTGSIFAVCMTNGHITSYLYFILKFQTCRGATFYAF